MTHRINFDHDEFMENCEVDEHNLTKEMARNPGLLGFYGYQEALWDAAMKALKIEAANKEGELQIRLKGSPDKYTADQAKGWVASHPELLAIKKAQNRAEEQKTAYTNATNAIAEKGRQIQSMSVRQRQEYSGIHSGGIMSPSPYTSPSITPSVIPTYTKSVSSGMSSEAAKEKLNSLLSDLNAKKPLASDDVPF